MDEHQPGVEIVVEQWAKDEMEPSEGKCSVIVEETSEEVQQNEEDKVTSGLHSYVEQEENLITKKCGEENELVPKEGKEGFMTDCEGHIPLDDDESLYGSGHRFLVIGSEDESEWPSDEEEEKVQPQDELLSMGKIESTAATNEDRIPYDDELSIFGSGHGFRMIESDDETDWLSEEDELQAPPQNGLLSEQTNEGMEVGSGVESGEKCLNPADARNEICLTEQNQNQTVVSSKVVSAQPAYDEGSPLIDQPSIVGSNNKFMMIENEESKWISDEENGDHNEAMEDEKQFHERILKERAERLKLKNMSNRCRKCNSDDCKKLVASDLEVDFISSLVGSKGNPEINALMKEDNLSLSTTKIMDQHGFIDMATFCHWTPLANTGVNCKIRHQPFMKVDRVEGEKFRIIVVAGMQLQERILTAVLDCGSFLSCISKQMASELGYTPYRVRPMVADTASGRIIIKYNVQITIKMGGFSVQIKFAVVDDGRYKDSLILIGNNFLQATRSVIDINKMQLKLEGKYPVQIASSEEQVLDNLWKLRKGMLEETNVSIETTMSIDIYPNSDKILNVKLTNNQAEILKQAFVFGKQGRKTKWIIAEMLI